MTKTCVGSSCSEKVTSGGVSFLGGTIGIAGEDEEEEDDALPEGGVTTVDTFTVNKTTRGVASRFPAASVALTVIVCAPFTRLIYVFTELQAL